MPIEASLLKDAPVEEGPCPNCGDEPIEPFMRGQVQRRNWTIVWDHHYRDVVLLRYFTLRFNWWIPRVAKRPYCAVICYLCKEIIAWEDPDDYPRPEPDHGPTVIYMSSRNDRQKVHDAAVASSAAMPMDHSSASCCTPSEEWGPWKEHQPRTIKVKGRVTLSRKVEEVAKEADDADL